MDLAAWMVVGITIVLTFFGLWMLNAEKKNRPQTRI